VAIAREIGLTLARRYDPRALDLMTRYDPELRDNTVSEWRLRLLLRLGRWEDAYELTKRLPQDLASTNRWKYWQARSLELAQPNNPQIPLLYKTAARERDFYGFLAADRAQTLPAEQQAAAAEPQLDQQGAQHARHPPRTGIPRPRPDRRRPPRVVPRQPPLHP
jgi:hypothetical protein